MDNIKRALAEAEEAEQALQKAVDSSCDLRVILPQLNLARKHLALLKEILENSDEKRPIPNRRETGPE